jgi:hypothetical protein
MPDKSLSQIAAEQPYPDYMDWWPIGEAFLQFMADAICAEWLALPGNPGDLAPVREFVQTYIRIVYNREAREGLVNQFFNRENLHGVQSGEFDALSYGFFRAAFELVKKQVKDGGNSLEKERRLFTRRVGKRFFGSVHNKLQLALPQTLKTNDDFARLSDCLARLGTFLQEQGYLRDHFAFRFDVSTTHQGRRINQAGATFIAALNRNGAAYALYEMGYPVILPSAVYLYHTMGEAQHHSSRTIEELFALIGYQARETDDFDPTGYSSDMVVELWEISSR